MSRRIAALASVAEFPAELSGCRVYRVKVAVVAVEVDKAVIDGRRRSNTRSGCECPLLRAGLLIDGIEVAVIAANVYNAVDDRRRRDDFAARVECPLDPFELWNARGGVDAGVGKIVPEHWSVLREGECGEEKNERGFEKKPLFVQMRLLLCEGQL